MILLLARHGNTFDPDTAPYVVGRAEDLPLVAEGEAQARRLANFLRQENLLPDRIVCGDLQRTRRTAEIIAMELNLRQPISDLRLTELDYGDWSGLSMDEIRERYGSAEVEAWDHEAIMPEGRNWYPSAELVCGHIQNFVEDTRSLGHKIVLAVTSNGILRYFPILAPAAFATLQAEHSLKVGTGNICRFDWTGQEWQMVFWNRRATS